MNESLTHATCRHTFYLMNCEEFDQLIARSEDCCEICGVHSPVTKHGKLHIDHDAAIGDWAVRGLLCSACNTRLGPGIAFSAESERYLTQPWRNRNDRDRILNRPDPWIEWKGRLQSVSGKGCDRVVRNAEIAQAAREGMRQRDIVAATGLTREQIRRIVRAAENSGPSEQ